MNHRELILSAQKKPKFGFLTLPEDLQDEIVDGLDLKEASEMVKAREKRLSHEAIASYYRAVRRERRLYESRRNMSHVIAGFAGLPPEESVRGLFGWIIAAAANGLAEGTVRIRDINLARIVGALRGAVQAGEDGVDDEKISSLGPEATRKLVEEVEKALGCGSERSRSERVLSSLSTAPALGGSRRKIWEKSRRGWPSQRSPAKPSMYKLKNINHIC